MRDWHQRIQVPGAIRQKLSFYCAITLYKIFL